jgi:photosystem II stability/assembly factor-like uncharacterized protein
VPEGVWANSLVAVSAQEAYVLGRTVPADPNGGGPTGPARLLHTTDGGRSWVDVDTDLPSTDAVRGITLGANGALLVGDTSNSVTSSVWISRDGGRHFTRSVRTGNEGRLGTSRGLVWMADREDPSDANSVVVQVSADGENWSRLLLPR